MLVSLRSSRPMLAFVPLAVAYLVGVLVGTQAAFQPYLTGALFFVTCLVWTTYRRGVDRGRLTGVRARLRPLRLLSGIAMLAVAAAVWGLNQSLPPGTLPVGVKDALIVGYLSHLLGDWLTPAGIPLFWPIKRRFRLPGWPLRSGGALETGFCTLTLLVAGWWCGWRL